jgi:hypothetical protein
MQIDLENEAALILFELITARENELVTALGLQAAERNALWALQGALEKVLVEPFSPDYDSLLAAARRSMVERGGE